MSGALVTNIGYYTPFMLAGTVLTSIGAGLLTTFEPNTNSSKWIGYQVLCGFGIGVGLQLPLIAVQTVLDMSEIPIATAMIIFMQLLGASIFISVSESVLTNKLISYISQHIPGVDPTAVARSGATELQNLIPPAYLPGAIQAYNDGVVQIFKIALVLACLTSIGSVAMQWRSVKEEKTKAATA